MREFLARPFFAYYYWHNRQINRLLPVITLDGRRMRVLPTIYKPLDNAHRVVDEIDQGKTVLDMGCGSGVITVFAALKSRQVTAVDINAEAVENTKQNCAAHGITNVTVKQSDMFSAVEGQFDYIISYPPLFHLAFGADERQWCTSTHFVGNLFQNARAYLRPGGRLIVALPKSFRSSPGSLAEQNGLRLESARPASKRPLSVRLHSILHLHLHLNIQTYTFVEN